MTLHAQSVKLTTELPNRASPSRRAEVRRQVNAVILKRLFTEGDTVQAGQQLYLIDPAPYEASLASTQLDGAKYGASRRKKTALSHKRGHR
jgi:membrane fusion protein (multidrug efflux system)